MAALTTAAIVAGSAMAVGTVGSLIEGRKARKASEKAHKIDEKRNKLQTMKGSMEKIRQAQLARSDMAQMGENQGVAGGSMSLGGQYSATSQMAGDIGFAQQIFGMQQSAGRLRMQAQKHEWNAGAIAAIGEATASIASNWNAGTTPKATTDGAA